MFSPRSILPVREYALVTNSGSRYENMLLFLSTRKSKSWTQSTANELLPVRTLRELITRFISSSTFSLESRYPLGIGGLGTRTTEWRDSGLLRACGFGGGGSLLCRDTVKCTVFYTYVTYQNNLTLSARDVSWPLSALTRVVGINPAVKAQHFTHHDFSSVD